LKTVLRTRVATKGLGRFTVKLGRETAKREKGRLEEKAGSGRLCAGFLRRWSWTRSIRVRGGSGGKKGGKEAKERRLHLKS